MLLRKAGILRMTAALAGAVAVIGLSAGPALASPALNVSFSSSAGSTAHWLPKHSGILLSVAGNPSTAYAVASLHHFDHSALPTEEPSFSATGYAAGTPRLVIVMNDGAVIFGYSIGGSMLWEPHASGLPMYTSDWAAVTSFYASDGVSQVFIVADGSQPLPYSATVSNIEYGGAYPSQG